MSEAMLDKMAKAMIDELPNFIGEVDGTEVDYIDCGSVDFKDLAVAALEALKNPDHDITAAVVAPTQDRTKAVSDWNAMIDALLLQAGKGE